MKIKLTLAAAAVICVLITASCKKYEEAPPLRYDRGLPLPVTDSLLNYSRTHFFLKVIDFTREYRNSTGQIDSTVNVPVYDDISQQRVDFEEGGINGNTSAVHGDLNPVNLTFPIIGNWDLSADGRQLTITPSIFFPEGGPGGIFTVGYFPDTRNPNFEPYQIDVKIVRNLPNNRTLKEMFTLQAALY